MKLAILGLGTAVPRHVMTQREATELARQVCATTEEQATLLKVLYRRSGVSARHTVVPHRVALEWLHPADEDSSVQTLVQLGPTTYERMKFYEEHAPPLALDAAAKAIEQAGVPGGEITHLITVSCTGFVAPGTDVALIRGLGLPATVERTQVGFMGCHGAINGLRVARGLAAADPEARVLVCAVELCSLHYHFGWDPKRCVGNSIFADGAAALVTRAGQPGDADAWGVAASGSCLIPNSTDAITWEVGDHGFLMGLSPLVPDLIRQHLRPWMDAWLDRQGLGVGEIGSWAVHPGGPRIVTAVEEALELPAGSTAVSREVLAELGNMSSPTVVFILERLRERGAPRPCVALGFGPGLMAEALLLT